MKIDDSRAKENKHRGGEAGLEGGFTLFHNENCHNPLLSAKPRRAFSRELLLVPFMSYVPIITCLLENPRQSVFKSCTSTTPRNNIGNCHDTTLSQRTIKDRR